MGADRGRRAVEAEQTRITFCARRPSTAGALHDRDNWRDRVTGQRLREVVLLKPISNGALNARLLSVLGNSLATSRRDRQPPSHPRKLAS
jgi:hypothetical protein